MKRRALLKTGLTASAVGVAAAAGLLTPVQVLAAYPKAAFEAKDTAGALQAALGSGSFEQSSEIKIKAPDIAENGSVVPVTVSTSLSNVESITLLADSNNSPMVGSFDVSNAAAFVSTRIKMGKTGNVFAVVKSGGRLLATSKEVKVTIGGCGG